MNRSKVNDFKEILNQKQPSPWQKFAQSFQSFWATKSKTDTTKFKLPRKKTGLNRKNNWAQPELERLSENSQKNLNKGVSKLLKILSFIFAGPLWLLWQIFNFTKKLLRRFLNRELVVVAVFSLIFAVITINFAQLQVLSSRSAGLTGKDILLTSQQIILSQRGQIYMVDMRQNEGQGKKYIPLTSSENLANLFFNPKLLKTSLENNLDLSTIVEVISSHLNLEYTKLYDLMKSETDVDNPKSYVLIEKFINANQKAVIEFLRTNKQTRSYVVAAGLGVEEQVVRSYPQGTVFANTLGYVPKFQVTREDALKTGCRETVLENERRNTVASYVPGDYSKAGYTVGYYGLEQKFCSQLAGLNGRKVLNSELGGDNLGDTKVVNGADIFTTIDRNLQIKAEQLLNEAVRKNTNAVGKPKNGTIIAMEAKTGKILAMASTPTYDPATYFQSDPESFRSIATMDYDVGSVMKPLTFAAAINEYQSGNLNSKNEVLGVPPDFRWRDYTDGKIYLDNSGDQYVIRNSQGKSYAYLGDIGLDTCMVLSINTCASTVADTLGNRMLKQYFAEKYLFGKATSLNLPGDTNGNVQNLDRDINCQYCYAQFGFGQGIFISPVQLLRAYTAIANNGVIVDPYMIEKIKYSSGEEDFGNSEDSPIKRNSPVPVLKESAARIVGDLMVKVISGTPQGVGANKASVPGYTIAGKTGTAEKTTNVNGQFCNYVCNRQKGLYAHTFVGYNVNSENRILVLVKLDEPRPGEVTNFSGDTVGPVFSEMMGFTLNYLGIKEDVKPN